MSENSLPGRSKPRAIVYALSIGLISVLIVELAARFIVDRSESEPVVPAEVGRFDAELGWANNPSTTASSSRTGYEIEYRINAQGLRDDETSYEKPEGTYRIVLLGDSRTFGYGVPIEKHFSRLLEGYFRDVEVINMGVSGYGVDQELLYLRSAGLQYAPDLVIAYVAHYGNHRHMHSRRFGRDKPKFELEEADLVLTNQPVSRPQEPAAGPLRALHRWLRGHSRAYEMFRDGVYGLVYSREAEDAVALRNSDAANLEDPEFRRMLYELGDRLVSAMHEESVTNGADFLLVTGISELHESSIAKGVPSLNVTAALDNPGFPLPGDLAHINEAGNGVLAWEIGSFLVANEVLPRRHW